MAAFAPPESGGRGRAGFLNRGDGPFDQRGALQLSRQCSRRPLLCGRRGSRSYSMANLSLRPDLRIAVAGLGAIGTRVVEALDRGIDGLVLTAVSVQNPEKHRSRLANLTRTPAVLGWFIRTAAELNTKSHSAKAASACTSSRIFLRLGVVRSLGATLWPIATRTTYRRHNVNLAGLFRTSPIAGIKNCYARLQKGKAIAMENQKTKIDQFKRSFP